MNETEIYLQTIPYDEKSIHDKVGIRTSQYKYFRHARNSSENINLYELKKDPQENDNIAKNNPDIIEKLENILQNLVSKTNSENEKISLEETKRLEIELKKLGYIEEEENLTYDEVNSDK
jgi:hypothetical protein